MASPPAPSISAGSAPPTAPAMASAASAGAGAAGPPLPGPSAGAIEKQRRPSGKYIHPFGGMRRFAEDRARQSGWDTACLSNDSAEKRKAERNKLSDALAEQYKEAFIKINVDQGKGRPKANNISAAKKTVRMIAERVLLALEARSTQLMFDEFAKLRKNNEDELEELRRIKACGRENPRLTYDEIVQLVRDKISNEECLSDEFLPGEKLVKPETAVPPDVAAALNPPPVMKEFVDDDDAGREALKQALVEMRADEIAKGQEPTLISPKWVQQLTAAANELVEENYRKQYAPVSTGSNPDGSNGGAGAGRGAGSSRRSRSSVGVAAATAAAAAAAAANASRTSSVVVETSGSGTGANGNGTSGVLGCPHFRRKNRVLMACCGTFPVCRMCHFLDQSRIHDIRIEPVETMLCVMCGNVQPKAQHCTKCGVEFGSYYCHICGITDDPVNGVVLRHCDQCRVCMPGMTFHCELCRACFALPVAQHFAAVHNHAAATMHGNGVEHHPSPHHHAIGGHASSASSTPGAASVAAAVSAAVAAGVSSSEISHSTQHTHGSHGHSHHSPAHAHTQAHVQARTNSHSRIGM